MKSLKIMIEVDMEGGSGITHLDQVVPGKEEWKKARKFITGDVKAAIKGIHKAAKENKIKDIQITVVDAHWAMNNIILEDIPNINLVKGIEREYPQLKGIDNTFDAVIALANHDHTPNSESQPGILSHTWLPGWRWFVNNQEVSETILNAYTAGEFNVPLILVAGDNIIVKKTKDFFNQNQKQIQGAVVKTALGLQSGIVKSLEKAQKEIENQTYKAIINLINGKYSPLICKRPVELKIIQPNKTTIIKKPTFHEAILKGAEILNKHYVKTLVDLEKNADKLQYEFIHC